MEKAQSLTEVMEIFQKVNSVDNVTYRLVIYDRIPKAYQVSSETTEKLRANLPNSTDFSYAIEIMTLVTLQKHVNEGRVSKIFQRTRSRTINRLLLRAMQDWENEIKSGMNISNPSELAKYDSKVQTSFENRVLDFSAAILSSMSDEQQQVLIQKQKVYLKANRKLMRQNTPSFWKQPSLPMGSFGLGLSTVTGSFFSAIFYLQMPYIQFGDVAGGLMVAAFTGAVGWLSGRGLYLDIKATRAPIKQQFKQRAEQWDPLFQSQPQACVRAVEPK